MAATQYLPLIINTSLTTNKSVRIPEARNFDEMDIVLTIRALNGAPTTATLDVDVESEAMIAGDGGTTDTHWTRLQSKFLGRTSNADAGSPTFTLGDFSLGAFAQVTQTFTPVYVEKRGVDTLLGNSMRVTVRVAFTGGTTPGWQMSLGCNLKSKAGLK